MLHNHKRHRKTGALYPSPTLKWVFDGPIVNPMPAVNDTSFNMRWDDMSAINAHGLVEGKGGVAAKAIYPSIGEVATFNKSLWSGDGKLTMHFRMKPMENAHVVIICRRDSNNDGQLVAGLLPTGNGKLSPYFWIGNSGTGVGLTSVTSQSAPPGEYMDVVYVRDGGNLKVYLNGVLSGEINVTNYGTNGGAWYLGRDRRDNNGIFRGSLEQFNLWKESALTSEEVSAVSNM